MSTVREGDSNPDIGAIGRTLIRILVTLGAAAAFFYFVVSVCADVWFGNDTVTVDKVYSAVTISLSITFGSAFVGWLGLSGAATGTQVPLDVKVGEDQWRRKAVWPFIKQLVASLSGAALIAMLVYLVAGALAGVTFVVKEDETPAMLVTVATAWAAQTSAIIAATLAIALKPEI